MGLPDRAVRPLIWSICRRHHLDDAATDDVGQAVWLQLLDHLGELRDPAALADWLAATTRTECARALRAARGPQAAGHMLDAERIPDEQTPIADQEPQAADRHAALRDAFARLPRCCQQLIAALTGDPPAPDAQISATLGIPAGSIGPRRSRCLDKLRRDPAIAALINTQTAAAEATSVSGRTHIGPAMPEPQLIESQNPGNMTQNRQLCGAQPWRTCHEHAAHTRQGECG
jgi:RNA polymerase sigma factor (sigma-70 family)